MSKHIPTEADKQKMQQGAAAMRAVDAYLQHINAEVPRGRKADPVAIKEKMDEEENMAKKVILVSQYHKALEYHQRAEAEVELEKEFCKHAKWFSEQHGVTYAAWREIGVKASVLAEAGITA